MTIQWPGTARCAAVLSFDEDADSASLWSDPANERRLVTRSMGRYGPRVGTPDLLGLLRERGVPATFFMPGWVIEQYPDTVAAVLDGGHEVAAHGYQHERPDALTPEQEAEVMARSVEIIRRVTGQAPRGYRSPAWELTPTTLSLLHQHGFQYSSNMMDDLLPYLHTPPEGGEARLIELPVQWLLCDVPFFHYAGAAPRPIRSTDEVLRIWVKEFEGIAAHGGVFVLTLHPMIIGRPSRVELLGQLVDELSSRFDVWWATGEQVAAHCRSQDLRRS